MEDNELKLEPKPPKGLNKWQRWIYTIGRAYLLKMIAKGIKGK